MFRRLVHSTYLDKHMGPKNAADGDHQFSEHSFHPWQSLLDISVSDWMRLKRQTRPIGIAACFVTDAFQVPWFSFSLIYAWKGERLLNHATLHPNASDVFQLTPYLKLWEALHYSNSKLFQWIHSSTFPWSECCWHHPNASIRYVSSTLFFRQKTIQI